MSLHHKNKLASKKEKLRAILNETDTGSVLNEILNKNEIIDAIGTRSDNKRSKNVSKSTTQSQKELLDAIEEKILNFKPTRGKMKGGTIRVL